mmetsp:Transcript_16942/g.35566  ORF Transcript_16942/g.35566 Transcript_16942/m.35566 type:complete len:312 (+) Transcript_16942:1781-2716(+)
MFLYQRKSFLGGQPSRFSVNLFSTNFFGPPTFMFEIRCREWLVIIRCNFQRHLLQQPLFPALFYRGFILSSLHFRFRHATPGRKKRRLRIPGQHKLLHELINSKLNSNHGYHTQQSRCKPTVESANSFFFQNPPEAIIDSLVWHKIWIIHLRHEACFDGIHGNHDTNGSCTSQTSHDGIFDIFCRAFEHFCACQFNLLKKGPGETITGYFSSDSRPPTRIKTRNTPIFHQTTRRSYKIGICTRHDIVANHHLRRGNHRATNRRERRRQKIHPRTKTAVDSLCITTARHDIVHLPSHKFQNRKINSTMRNGE